MNSALARFFWFFALCVAYAPQWLVDTFASLVSKSLYLYRGKDRRRVQENVKRVYGLAVQSPFSTQFARQVFRSAVQSSCESLRAILRPDKVQILGYEDFLPMVRRALASGRGFVLVGAHHGSWELCGAMGGRASQEVAGPERDFFVLAKPSRLPALTLFLEMMRTHMHTKVLWTGRKTLLREMLTATKNGCGIGFVMDQKPEGRVGPVVQFLGQATEFVSGPAMLASKGAAVLAIACCRVGPSKFRVHAEEVLPPGHAETDQHKITQSCADALTGFIRMYPEQWVWSYKRWR